MHMSDALVSPTVAIGGGIIATTLIGVASRKVKKIDRPDLIPLMGVMGAFIFAAQMINFSIPGTGSSGHIIGGILLAAILGPWAGFLALSSVLIVQCFIFADGGLLALGCNIVNMSATSCLIGFPLIYKPIVGSSMNPWRIIVGSVLSSVIALEIGAFFVTMETEFSGITALPVFTFLKFMLPIHLIIGVVEGVATALVLVFISNYRPSVIYASCAKNDENKPKGRILLGVIVLITFILAAGFNWLASENPDGLEWSIEKVSGITELPSTHLATVLIPDYQSYLAGVVGSVIVMVMLWGFTSILFSHTKKSV